MGLLINALKNKEVGFFLVEVQDNRVLDDVALKIKVALGRAEKKTAVIDFLERGNESIPAFVGNRVKASADVQVFFIRNLEAAGGESPANLLRQLNMSRESIYYLNKNFVFFVYPDFGRLFTIFARDLFSWIPHRYGFEGGYMPPGEFAGSLKMEESVKFRGDRDRKYLLELIELYGKQLEEAPDDRAFKVQNIIVPLADLYHEIGDIQKELPLREEITEFHKKSSKDKYADALNNLGLAYGNLPIGDRGENLRKAIEAFREALKIYTPGAFPDDFKRTKELLTAAEKELDKRSDG